MSVYNTNVKQKTATYEHHSFNIFQFLKLNSRQKIQFCFAAFAFITFGIGDGVTGAYMMHVSGIIAEANPIVRYVVESHGFIGIILFKMYMTFMLLLIAFLLEIRSKDSAYWRTNGFFVSLAIGGVMATTANLMRVYGFEVLGHGLPSPALIILIYLSLTILLIMLGESIDNDHNSRILHQVRERPTIFSNTEYIVKNKPILTNVMKTRMS